MGEPKELLKEWIKGIGKPIYWLEGDEPFFIEQILNYAEAHVLSDAEKEFNFLTLYGKDTTTLQVLNACKRITINATKKLVIVKEAQHLKDLDLLVSYLEHPSLSSLLIVDYRNKKLDGRTKLMRLIKEKGVYFLSKKIYENELPKWTESYIKSLNLTIEPKALGLFVENVGNDLYRIKNEVDKINVNIYDKRKVITIDDIVNCVGVSREFNIFELQNKLGKKDWADALVIINYFKKNPKVAPTPLVLSSLHNYFNKLLIASSCGPIDDKTLSQKLGVHIFFVNEYKQAIRHYNRKDIETVLILLHGFNLKSIGIATSATDSGELLKDLLVKIMYSVKK
ncbi:MAG: DNA polymerase III subunit delta [Phycisphaerales bacterium]|nr:DNA polymerase III subunit delta [Phycisphaerales bacterium]